MWKYSSTLRSATISPKLKCIDKRLLSANWSHKKICRYLLLLQLRSGTNSTTLSTRSIVVPSSPVARTRCVTVRERRSASCIVGRLGRKGGRGKDGLERRDLRRGVLGDRKLVEVQTSSQSPMARCRSRSVKDEEDRASSSVTRRFSRSDSVEDVMKDPVGESAAMDWTVDRTSSRATVIGSVAVSARRLLDITVYLGM